MITYDEYIKMIPEETSKYVQHLLDFLACDKSFIVTINNCKQDFSIGLQSTILYKAIAVYREQTGDSLKEYIDIGNHNITYGNTSNSTRTYQFNKYRYCFIACNKEQYPLLTIEKILINFINEYYLNSGYVRDGIKNKISLINYLKDKSIKNKEIYKEEIIQKIFKDFSIENINYLTTVCQIKSYLKEQKVSFNDIEIECISFLLSIFYYKHVSIYGDIYNEQKRIINYLGKKGITLETIEKNLGIKIDKSKLDSYNIALELNNINELSFITYKNITIGLLFRAFCENYLTNFSDCKKVLNCLNLTPLSLSDASDIIDESFYKSYTQTDTMYKDLSKEMTILLHRLNKIYAYLLINRDIINPNYINNNQEVMTLALLLLSYDINSSMAVFLSETGMELDKVLEVLHLPKKDEYYKELNSTREMDSLIGRFKDLIYSGRNQNRNNNRLVPEDLFRNIQYKGYSNTTFINALYKEITKAELKEDFSDSISNFIRQRELRKNSELEEKLLSNVSIKVVKYLKYVSAFYNLYKNKTMNDEDKEQLAIIIAGLKYNSNLDAYFKSIGFSKSNICDFFGVSYDSLDPKMDINVIDGPLRKYIFDRDPKDITVYSIFSNAFNPKFKNSLLLREALHKKNKTPEDFINIKKNIDEFNKERKEAEKIANIKKLFSMVDEPITKTFEIILKVYERLTSITNVDDRLVLSIIYGILLSNNRYALYFENNNINIDTLSKVLNIDSSIFNIIEDSSFMKDSILAFEKYLTSYSTDDKMLVIRIFKKDISNSNIINDICKKLNINYDVLMEEVTNRKDKEITPELGIMMLDKEKTQPISSTSIPSITEYGLEISKHFKYINNSLHELIFHDTLGGSIVSVNDAINGIITEEEVKKKVGFFESLFIADEDIHQKVKKYNPEKIPELEALVNEYIVTLRKELQGYEYIKKYIELYLVKLQEYLNNLQVLNQSVELTSTDLTLIDDISNFTKLLDQKSVKDILDGKIKTFETMIMLMKQELVSVHQAIINHFITINSLELSRSAILPLLATEIAISMGNKTEKDAISLSNSLIELLHSVVNRNYEIAEENLEKLKETTLSDETLKILNTEVAGYLKVATSSQELLGRINSSNDETRKRC